MTAQSTLRTRQVLRRRSKLHGVTRTLADRAGCIATLPATLWNIAHVRRARAASSGSSETVQLRMKSEHSDNDRVTRKLDIEECAEHEMHGSNARTSISTQAGFILGPVEDPREKGFHVLLNVRVVLIRRNAEVRCHAIPFRSNVILVKQDSARRFDRPAPVPAFGFATGRSGRRPAAKNLVDQLNPVLDDLHTTPRLAPRCSMYGFRAPFASPSIFAVFAAAGSRYCPFRLKRASAPAA